MKKTAIPLLGLFLAVSTLGMAGCPPTPPNPPAPDGGPDGSPPPPVPTMDSAPTPTPAVDAAPAPTPAQDAAPPAPTDPCAKACAQMAAMGCAQQADCAKVLSLAQANRVIRNPKTQQGLTCNDLLGAKTSADVQAMGWNCGGASKH